MGCDYYIVKELKVEFNYGMFPFLIELERERGYFYFSLDEDEPDYDEKEREYIRDMLKPSMKPIVIYEESQFKSKKYENKYKDLICGQLEHYNTYQENKKEWNHISKITKIERRYERD
jgi:hypothetical protein